ncbi:MAG TPA: glycosyl transferase family protein [Allosphingosinicella sp.]|nr:glycosyl transferase family protein [Allosphingosinicella sp.]
MEWFGTVLAAAEILMREAALFAAFGFIILGAGDLVVDLLWIGHTAKRIFLYGYVPRVCAATVGPPQRPGPLAVFVPAWDEAEVIGGMLRHALAAFGEASYFIYVGCYPNDPATVAAVRAVADPRIRLVVGSAFGPTSKADCLNRLWDRMRADEAAEMRRFKAVVLHDAEDVVHSAELRIFDALVERFDLVQLPVLPLIDPGSRWIGGHYADEFAEAHGKELVVREALGAALPSAGVGCAISRGALDRMAAAQDAPFDPASLTEDYELGLKLQGLGGRAAFIRLPAGPGRPAVTTRGYFPATLAAAVQQKARWMTGIALAGWDRLGWSGGLAERWMRLRDRQSLLAAVILAAAYLALLLWGVLLAAAWLGGYAMAPIPPFLALLLTVNGGLLLWRLAMRFGFVARAYGWREGLRSAPRVVIGNAVAMLAARRALARYLGGRRRATAWDKTVHAFPSELPAE